MIKTKSLEKDTLFRLCIFRNYSGLKNILIALCPRIFLPYSCLCWNEKVNFTSDGSNNSAMTERQKLQQLCRKCCCSLWACVRIVITSSPLVLKLNKLLHPKVCNIKVNLPIIKFKKMKAIDNFQSKNWWMDPAYVDERRQWCKVFVSSAQFVWLNRWFKKKERKALQVNCWSVFNCYSK